MSVGRNVCMAEFELLYVCMSVYMCINTLVEVCVSATTAPGHSAQTACGRTACMAYVFVVECVRA